MNTWPRASPGTAIALDNARLYERQRDLARSLAESMLPVTPTVAGMQLVTRYLPAATGSKIGGDWFDVFPLPGSRTALVIGDVVGHGVTAATIMEQARTALRAYALVDPSPSTVLAQVSALLGTFIDAAFVTCFYAVLGEDGELVYANAGHLPALLRRADGAVVELGESLAPPLGVGTTFPQRSTQVAANDDLLLYTDGLVEARSRDLDEGMRNLVAAVDALPRPLTAGACDELIRRLTDEEHDDDIALIYVHRDEV